MITTTLMLLALVLLLPLLLNLPAVSPMVTTGTARLPALALRPRLPSLSMITTTTTPLALALSPPLPPSPLAANPTATTVRFSSPRSCNHILTIPGHCDGPATAAADSTPTSSNSAAVTDNAAIGPMIPLAGMVAAAVFAL